MPPVDDTLGQLQMDGNIEQEHGNDDNFFGKEKFDAGIDVDEDADPKKYIEKLTGKLAQKLRDYNGTEQDIDLNKFVINSLIPASIPQMDETDAKDVIKKVQDNIGKTGENSETNADMDISNDIPEQGVEQAQDEPQNENKINEIDDLINEYLSGKSVKRNIKNKNPFKSPKFK